MIADVILATQLASTWAMVGLIWFVQLVHYPLFARIEATHFPEFEQDHQRRTGWIVAPLMLTEGVSAVGLVWISTSTTDRLLASIALAMLVAIALSTFLWQVPLHERLSRGWNSEVHQRLVQSNWLRTILWTARGGIVIACMI
jgi:hypothetical protein